MKCRVCGSVNPPGARFCMACGTHLPAGEVAADAGTETARTITDLRRLVPREYADRLVAAGGRARGERRVVTILFLDVTGSTAMSEKLDPEDVMEIMNGAFEALVRPILRYGGTLARLTGDGILAFFGAPVAHEDDPDRASHAALEIVEAARRYGAELRGRRGIEGFDVRVGLNSGLVVVGEVGSDLRVEYTAMGDAVNLAARMEAVADPGTVLVTAQTRALAGSAFDFEDAGLRLVKGRQEPVRTYRLVGRGITPAGDDGLASRLVGRNRELGSICAAVDAVLAGHGGVLAVTGEAGVGKTRLVAEARDSRPQAAWLTVQCASYDQGSSFQVVRELLLKLIGADRLLPPETAQLVLRLAGGAADSAVTAVAPAQTRERTVEILREFVEERAAEGPLVIVVDDAHWADPSSLGALAEVLRVADESRVLFILVYRPGAERLDELTRVLQERDDAQLHVQPLGEGASEQLLDSLLQGQDMPAPARALVLQVAEGSPFFIREVVRSMVELGLADEALAGGFPHASAVAIPITVQGAITARLDRLPVGDRRILQSAAVIGRLFETGLLAELMATDIDPAALEHRLESLAAKGFIHPAGKHELAARHADPGVLSAPHSRHLLARARSSPDSAYVFRDPMTTEVCYKSLLKRERQAMHARVAAILEKRHEEGTGSCSAAVLAYHFDKAGDVARAVAYLTRAAARSRAIGAAREAEAFDQRARELAEPGSEQR